MEKEETILEQIKDMYPDESFLYPTGYEDCVIGVEYEDLVLIMDADKIIAKLVKEDSLSEEDAIEHFSFNIAGSKGEGLPIYAHTFKK